MRFYVDERAEAAALRRAVARSACGVRRLGVQMGSVTSDIACADGWGAARLLLALAAEDARTPGARRLAAELRAVAPEDEAYAREVHAFVRRHVRFAPEIGELFQSGAATLRLGVGDCDDHFRLAYALAVAGGLPAALGLLHHGLDEPGPTHAAAMLGVAGQWAWAETTVDARFGEAPNDAAARLGLTHARTDIAREVIIMTEQDLPPVPAGFRDRNRTERVLLDAEALQRLGYLADDVPAAALTDPTSTPLRLAVIAFQRARGLTPDGLLGDRETRPELARALAEAGAPVCEGFAYPGIGDLAAPVPVNLSADLSDEFLSALLAMAQRFGARGSTATAEDFARVWFVESAGLHSHVPNGAGEPFGGMNQMGPTERRAAGFSGTFAEWLALSELDQLPFVERYYAAKPVQFIKDARGVYVATFAPAFLPKSGDPDAVLYRYAPREGMPAVGASSAEWAAYNKTHSDPYGENRTFDRERKGFITVADLARPISSIDGSPRWREIQARIRALGGGTIVSSSSSVGAVVAGLIAFVVAAGALTWWTVRS